MTSEPRRRTLISLAVLALAVLATVLVAVDVTAAIRPFAVFAAALVVPGTAIVLRLPLRDGVAAFGLVVGLSLAVETLVALVMVWTHWWHPEVGAAAIVAASALAVLYDLRASRAGAGAVSGELA